MTAAKAKGIVVGSSCLVVLAFWYIAWVYARSAQQARLAFQATAERRIHAQLEIRRLDARFGKAQPVLKSAPEPKLNETAAKHASLLESLRKFEEDQKDPKTQLRQLAARRAEASAGYGPLFLRLAMSPGQIDRFLQNIGKRDETEMDLNAVLWAEAKATGTISPEAARARDEIEAQTDSEYQASQLSILGEAGYAQLREYDRILPAQDFVRGLAGTAVLSGDPLTPQQIDQFTLVLADASSEYRSGQAVAPRKIDWSAVDTRARSLLSPTQMAILQTVAVPTSDGGRFWPIVNGAVNKAASRDELNSSTPNSSAPGG